ncbi:MAG: tripartite tricarboxylate transporter substrate binding protein [Limnohabitans sp.]
MHPTTPMTLSRRRLALGLGGLALFGRSALAQSFPSKPITLIVPYPAGGPSDFVARKVQADLARALGQPVVIENLGGVAGALGVQKMLSAPADGHTITLGSPLELVIAPITLAAVKYKPQDVQMAAQLVRAPLVLLARKDLPANTLEELVALARKSDKPLTMANVGHGSLFHLVGEKLTQLSGAKFLHVPYKGGAPIISDMMGGQIDLGFGTFAGPVPSMVASGKIKAIGLTTRTPVPGFTQLTPLAGLPGMQELEFNSWAGLQVPRGTPEAVLQKINQAAQEALRNPETRKAFEESGNQITPPTSVIDTDRSYQAEIARYQAIARAINLQPQ